MAARKKPANLGSIPEREPEPENPVAPPGDGFIMVGKAMYDEQGVMLIDEDGDMTEELEEQLAEDAEENENLMRSSGLDPYGNPLEKEPE